MIGSGTTIYLFWASVSPLVNKGHVDKKVTRPWHPFVPRSPLFGPFWHLGSTWEGGSWGAAVAEQLGSVGEHLSLSCTLSSAVRTVGSPAWMMPCSWAKWPDLKSRSSSQSRGGVLHTGSLHCCASRMTVPKSQTVMSHGVQTSEASLNCFKGNYLSRSNHCVKLWFPGTEAHTLYHQVYKCRREDVL